MGPESLGALTDSQFLKDIKGGLFDVVNRGAIAGSLGAPVDIATMFLRPLGYSVENPVGGSEWIGQKMQETGVVSGNRRPIAEVMASMFSPAGVAKTISKTPKIAAGMNRMVDNAMAPTTLNKQRGVLAWHGPEKKNNLDADYLQDLISSQRYLDRDIVSKKIKDGSFDVRVSPVFELDGQNVRAIQDGHHALEAAIRSGNRPNFIEQTVTDDDRIYHLNKGRIQDFLDASYMDSPWYKFATKEDLY